MLQLDNIATEDEFPGDDNDPAGSLSDQHSDLLSLDVAGAPVYVQFRPYDEDRQNELDWSADQIRIVAPKSLLIPDVAGVRVRSATPGSPASVTAQLFEPDDPGRPSAASSAVQVLTTVGQIGVQHNGALQDSENTLDLEDSAQVLWTVTPDPAHGRVQVDAAIAASVALTGSPTSTTPGTGDNSTKIATTAYVQAQGYATLASPAFTGTPTAPTPLSSDNSTKIATTAYVQAQGYVTAASAPVTHVFGRTGSVVALAGDYTAAQVTNAADKSSGATQSFAGGLTTAGTLIGGAGTTFVTGGGVTWTPDYSTGNFQAANVDVSGSTTLTITTPSNGPSANNSGVLMMLVENTGGSGGTTLTWSGAFLNAFSSITKPTSVSAGASVLLLFIYQPTTLGWKCVARY